MNIYRGNQSLITVKLYRNNKQEDNFKATDTWIFIITYYMGQEKKCVTETRKILELNDNKNAKYQSYEGATKVVLRGKHIASNS